MKSNPPGFARVVLLLAGVGARRFWNRMGAWRRRKHDGARSATARKGRRVTPVVALFFALMLFNSIMVCTNFANSLSSELEERYGKEPSQVLIERLDRGNRIFPDAKLWLPGLAGRDMNAAFGLVLAALTLSLFFMGLSGGNQELAQVGWSMEWLFTLPASTRGLFLARVGEYTVTNIFAWLTAGPLLFVLLVGNGWGWLALPIALLATLYVNALVGAARLTAETYLRKTLSLQGLKNMQALGSVLGIATFFALYLFAIVPGSNGPFISLAMATPTLALVQPLSAPALFVLGAPGLLAVAAFGMLCVWIALRVCESLVRDGLITVAGGPLRGQRGTPRATDWDGGTRRHGLLGKEALLLWRDRNFLVQTLVVPLLLVAFWGFTMSRSGSERWGGETGAVVAFVVGAYVLMYGGFSILVTEIKALWLLYTLPQPLHRMLSRKALLWAATASLYTVGGLAFLWRPGAETSFAGWVSPVMALLGIYLFAFLAGGLGVLGTDPFALEVKRRIKPAWAYLYLFLIAVYAHGVASDALQVKVAMLAFVGLLAYALWDRVGDLVPLMLDPTAEPKPRLTMTEGIVAGLLYLELTQLFLIAMAESDWPNGARLVMALFLSGMLSVAISLLMLRGLGGKGIREAVGMQGGPRGGVAAGAVAGAAVACIALLYIHFAQRFEGLREAAEQAREVSALWDYSMRLGMAVIAVALAPLFEEFIFRGLIFRAMRQRLSLPVSVTASAALFTLVHPPISWLPVFCLGAAAALVLERTRMLRAAIATHVVYNAIVVFTQW